MEHRGSYPSIAAASVLLGLVIQSCIVAPASADIVAASAADVCSPAADPCVVSERVELVEGAILDFATRTVQVGAGGMFDLVGRSATLRCGRLELMTGAADAIELVDPALSKAGFMLVEVRRSCSGDAGILCLADLDCSAAAAGICSVGDGGVVVAGPIHGTADLSGSFTLRAAGDVAIEQPISVDAASTLADGGMINVDAGGSVVLGAPLDTSSGARAAGGEITVRAGSSVSVNAALDASGGEDDGGSIVLAAGGDVVVSDGLDAKAAKRGGFGGEISVSAGADIRLIGGTSSNRLFISTAGHGPVGGSGGDGGSQSYVAVGSVEVGPFMRLRADGAAPDGFAGELFISAGASVTIEGELRSRALGGSGGGGDVTVAGRQGVEVAVTAVLDVVAGGQSIAGTADFSSSRGTVVIAGTVSTNGAEILPGAVGLEVVTLSACSVDLGSTGLVDNRVASSTTRLTGFDGIVLRVGSRLLADVTGTNELRYPAGGTPPVIDGTVQPAAMLVADATIHACAVCGNAAIETGETCDDGNAIDGDGCSADCQNEGCLAQTPGWPQVALCDDGLACTDDRCDTGTSTCANELNCDDGVGCTVDSCDAAGRCVSVASDALCDDGNVCTSNLCGAVNGCVTGNRNVACDDGLSCTIDDFCSDGLCLGTDVCPAGQVCSLDLGICGEPTTTTTTSLPTTTTTVSTTTTTLDGGGSQCGNAVVEPGEECDDGDMSWLVGEVCRADCSAAACGDPDDSGTRAASDALFILRAAVGVGTCQCICDVNASGGRATASDALALLRAAVGLPVVLSCSC